MSVKQRIGHAVVRSHPEPIYIADMECVVKLYVPSERHGDSNTFTNPEVIIGVGIAPARPYGDENNPVLPFNTMFPVYLDEGQVLYAISPGESEVSFTALPVPASVAGY